MELWIGCHRTFGSFGYVIKLYFLAIMGQRGEKLLAGVWRSPRQSLDVLVHYRSTLTLVKIANSRM